MSSYFLAGHSEERPIISQPRAEDATEPAPDWPLCGYWQQMGLCTELVQAKQDDDCRLQKP